MQKLADFFPEALRQQLSKDDKKRKNRKRKRRRHKDKSGRENTDKNPDGNKIEGKEQKETDKNG